MLSEHARMPQTRLSSKDCWHLYGLQHLTPNRFARVVGKILRGRDQLITTREKETTVTAPPLPPEA